MNAPKTFNGFLNMVGSNCVNAKNHDDGGETLRELLDDIREYLDQRADCDIPSGESPRPNDAMQLLARLDHQLQRLPFTPMPVLCAIERLRGSHGPGGIRRADVLLLCNHIDPQGAGSVA